MYCTKVFIVYITLQNIGIYSHPKEVFRYFISLFSNYQYDFLALRVLLLELVNDIYSQ